MVKNSVNEAEFTLVLVQTKDYRLQEAGLKLIIDSSHYLWPEYCEKISIVEALYGSKMLPGPLIAYALAHIYFYADKLDDALKWIIFSTGYFEISKRSFFNDAILPLIIKRYSVLIKSASPLSEEIEKLSLLTEQMLENSLELNLKADNKILVGLAIDTKKYGFLTSVISKIPTGDLNSIFEGINTILDAMTERESHQIFKIFSEEFEKRNFDSSLERGRCLSKLSLADQHAELICKLWKEDRRELALQIAYEVSELGNIVYAETVQTFVREFLGATHSLILEKLISGTFSQKLGRDFLKGSAVADLDLIKTLLHNWKVKDSVFNNAIAFSLGTILKGTEKIDILKNYTTQFEKIKHWASFSMTASLGNIFTGNTFKEEMKELKFQESSPSCQGGELMARGLANYCRSADEGVKASLVNSAKSTDQVVAHGALLSIGLRFAFSNDSEIIETCKLGMYSEIAIVGEAASLALGMVKATHWDQELSHSLINFCRDNDHTKITRSLSIFYGLSAMKCSHPDEILTFFEQYIIENDYIIRSCVVNALSMAYIGTGNSIIVSKLLAVIAGDVSSDVRRSAVIGLTMVMLNKRPKAISLLSMLSTSYNGYVRHAVALALGLISSHSFDKKVTKIVRKLFEDKTDYVRQAAAISLGLIYQLGNDQIEPNFESIRKLLTERLERKHENPLSKFGCAVGLSLTNPGGGNCILTLKNSNGSIKLKNILPVFTFTHYWYWFPCIHTLTLAIEPSFIAGVDANLNVPPEFVIYSKAPKRYFDYVRPTETAEEKKKDAAPVQLSSTKRAKLRQEKKDSEKDVKAFNKSEMLIEENKEDARAEKADPKEEKKVSQLSNPARVLRKQLPFIDTLHADQHRYVPVVETLRSGVIFVIDKNPQDPSIIGKEVDLIKEN